MNMMPEMAKQSMSPKVEGRKGEERRKNVWLNKNNIKVCPHHPGYLLLLHRHFRKLCTFLETFTNFSELFLLSEQHEKNYCWVIPRLIQLILKKSS